MIVKGIKMNLDYTPKSKDLQNLEQQQELLTILMEECAEIQQQCSKIIRFGDSSTNQHHLAAEIGDMLCIIDLMKEYEAIDPYLLMDKHLESRKQQKRDKLKVFSNLPIK